MTTIDAKATSSGSSEVDTTPTASPSRRVEQGGWRGALDLVATVAMLIVAGVTLWNRYHVAGAASAPPARGGMAVPTQPLSLDGLPLLGSSAAKVGLLVFSDFQCPFCARFENDTMPTLKARYVDKGLVDVAFRHMPLPTHSRASRAAQSAECAAEQGQFWTMHDALFKSPSKLEEADFVSDATAIGLDIEEFTTCMNRPPADRIKHDTEVAQTVGVTGTPAFVIGTIDGRVLHAKSVLSGARPVDEFEKAMDQALKG